MIFSHFSKVVEGEKDKISLVRRGKCSEVLCGVNEKHIYPGRERESERGEADSLVFRPVVQYVAI